MCLFNGKGTSIGDVNLDAVALFESKDLNHGPRQPNSEAVSPFCDLHDKLRDIQFLNVYPKLHCKYFQDSNWQPLEILSPRFGKKVLDTALVRAPCTARNGYAMNKKLKSIPKFRSEAEERRFWETHDSSDFIDWTKAQRLRFPNLKPSTTAISLRLPVTLLERIKVAANKRDVPYQSLIKTWLAEKTGTR